MPKPPSYERAAPGLRRRDFLTLSSIGVAGLWLGGFGRAEAFSRAAAIEAAAAAAPPRPMSLGYLAGSDELPYLMYLPQSILRPSTRPRQDTPAQGIISQVVRADGLPGGDPSLIGPPFWMKIHGLYPPAALTASRQKALPLAVDLDVLFPPPDPVFPKPARFLAWSFRRRPGWNPSPPTKFVFPLDWQAMPRLEMRVVPANGGPPITLTTRFTLDYETGLPRLHRGIYLLGLAADAWRSDVALADLARTAPPELVSVMVSFATHPVET